MVSPQPFFEYVVRVTLLVVRKRRASLAFSRLKPLLLTLHQLFNLFAAAHGSDLNFIKSGVIIYGDQSRTFRNFEMSEMQIGS